MTDYAALLGALQTHGVAFIIIGGAAAVAHGSARVTQDLDIVYQRSAQNMGRLIASIAEFKPYPRGAPPGLPFSWDRATLARGLNFTLTTSAGDLDLFGEIPGGGGYDDLIAGTIELDLFGMKCRCLNLRQLIRAKRAAGRPRDLEALAELESIEEENR